MLGKFYEAFFWNISWMQDDRPILHNLEITPKKAYSKEYYDKNPFFFFFDEFPPNHKK